MNNNDKKNKTPTVKKEENAVILDYLSRGYVKSDMSKLQDRYEKLADKLKALQEQKRQIEADVIMDAYLKSGKSFDEIMTFLNP